MDVLVEEPLTNRVTDNLSVGSKSVYSVVMDKIDVYVSGFVEFVPFISLLSELVPINVSIPFLRRFN